MEWEVVSVSIVRVGLAETKGFDEGYEAIFGKKQAGTKKAEAKKTEAADKSKKAKTKSKKKAKKK